MRLIRHLLLLLTVLGGISVEAGAQVKEHASWTYKVKSKGNNTYDLIFHVQLEKDWHIWSQNPGGDGSLVFPEFTFDKNPKVTKVGKVKESGKLITGNMTGIEGAVHYYENAVDFTQTVKVTGNGPITGKLLYQICDLEQCQAPMKPRFTFTITDAKEDSAALAAAPPADTTDSLRVANVSPVDTAAKKPVADTATGGASGVTTMAGSEPSTACNPAGNFFSGLGNGLLSVITPCVFAMLPMTVSFFLKRSKDRKTGIKIALQYSLSIVVIFTVIGGVMSLVLGPDALHAFSTNWIVNIGFFVIFLIFGISFLGAFEINLPSSWATKMDSKANMQSFAGIFFMALTLVIVSFSCTVPFIGNVVVALQGGCKVGPLMGFFGFGVGLALPFTLFAIFPSLLNELGKSGGWLNAVKVVFGFVELGLAMKFLSNADLQKGWRLLDREIFLSIWIGLSFVLSFYLLGFIRFSHDSEMPKNDWGLTYLKVPRLFFALAAFIFGLYLLPGMWGAPLNGMGAFLPPMGTQDFVTLTNGASAAASGENSGLPEPKKYVERMHILEPASVRAFNLNPYFDYEEALAAARIAHKPVMLDFTGVGCANCRKFEAEVWSKPEVLKRLKNDFIIASMYTDAQGVDLDKSEIHYSEAAKRDVETLGDKCTELQITKFATNTQPYYYFVDENGVILADKGIPYPYAPQAFVLHLDKVKARYKELHP